MDRQAAVKIIKDTFESSFDKGQFINLSKNLVKYLDGSKNFTYQGNIIPDAYEQSIQTLERVGKYEDADGNKIDVLIVRLKKEHSLERARTMQRNFVAWYLNGSRGGELKDAALVAFVSPESEDWRFSLVRMDYNIAESPSGKMKVETELTPAHRYSFLVGENESSHTAQVQLLPILENDERKPLLSDFEKAFSIEVVTREFFTKYRELFHKVEEALQELVEQNKRIRDDFEAKGVDTVNFAKKLLGQVVFLYFLQKKGWFGVGRDEDWGKGPKDFLRRLFEKKIAAYSNFFNDVLEPLFYEALAVERAEDFYSRFNCKIPFLNGGLFDPINNYDWVHTDILLPNELFSNTDKTKEGDTGTGILDVFDRYNFTVKEDEPLDKEVAVDPEMLGKVFENLLEVKDRKSKGTYYTPREIVHYMCQESLINYLDTAVNTGDVPLVAIPPPQGKLFGKPDPEQGALKAPAYRAIVPHEDIEAFVRMGELAIEHDARVESTGRETRDYSYKLPPSIRLNAALIDDKLASIRVCDPAIGSGAFPVGLMTEIVRARNTLTTYLPDKEGRTNYHFKRHAIQNCLYGVDIDPGAVEIAKLRLWLSLVVDEEDIKQIQPLPNLDYKIVCGDSLLGVERNMFNNELFRELEDLKPLYFNETNAKKKQSYRDQIDRLIGQITNKNRDFDFEVYFSEVFHEKGGFDVVIANPPYLRQESLENKEYFKKKFSCYHGMADLYTYFIEESFSILRDRGIFSFIVSNRFTHTNYGKNLRGFLAKKDLLCLVNLNGIPVFENANVDTLLILASNRPSDGREVLVCNIEYSPRYNVTINDCVRIYSKCSAKKYFSENAWSFQSDRILEIRRKIENRGKSLSQIRGIKINRGITTGLNSVFIINEDIKNGILRMDQASDKLIRPIAKGEHIKRWSLTWSNSYLVYTYTGIDIKKYPGIFNYLSKYKYDLENVWEAKHGKKKWYELRGCNYYSEFEKEKIMYTRLSNINSFMISTNGEFCLDSAGIIVTSDNKYYCAILNSRLIHFYFKMVSVIWGKDGIKWFGRSFDNIPIYEVEHGNSSEVHIHDNIVSLVDQILAITKDKDYLSNPTKQAEVKEPERQIDQMVYELYGLTPEEIAVVEGIH